jgi:AmmeMemoRadiSam system protein A
MEAVRLPIASQKTLIQLCRKTLDRFVRGTGGEEGEVDDPYLLSHDYGAFVSLHKGKELRGCIGTCFPTQPLYRTVIEVTEASASRDYRVPPIGVNELREIHIAVSVLSPLEPVADPLSLEAGKHGLHLTNGELRGVLLPQVATEYGWGMETFLGQTCLKAGLSIDAWRRPETQIMSFTGLVIEEEKS